MRAKVANKWTWKDGSWKDSAGHVIKIMVHFKLCVCVYECFCALVYVYISACVCVSVQVSIEARAI